VSKPRPIYSTADSTVVNRSGSERWQCTGTFTIFVQTKIGIMKKCSFQAVLEENTAGALTLTTVAQFVSTQIRFILKN
jgi:hypothetical protein